MRWQRAGWEAAAAPADDAAVLWNDPNIGIEWPIKDPILSEKDAAAPALADLPDLLLGE